MRKFPHVMCQKTASQTDRTQTRTILERMGSNQNGIFVKHLQIGWRINHLLCAPPHSHFWTPSPPSLSPFSLPPTPRFLAIRFRRTSSHTPAHHDNVFFLPATALVLWLGGFQQMAHNTLPDHVQYLSLSSVLCTVVLST